jgi:hypothetical protein
MVLTVVLGAPLHAAAVVGTETVTEYYADEAARVLKPVRQFFEMRGYKVKTTYQVGHPAEVIAKCSGLICTDTSISGSFHL